ncbi:RAMP superfamily CRISPR-associated protein [Leptotrichia trevisanii]|uniref:CRISPR-associated protein Csm3 n=1 Tax=Leptotrichia trevisanii TaxID=109328 RepID=A0A510K0E6_9FUSO|nr:RAMP superfamily CRISPR-associated protein [Leptotrichia trevisanii]BBM45119.1 CRISPR-associated protein Csm3 [Leptotrichia trevisanii]
MYNNRNNNNIKETDYEIIPFGKKVLKKESKTYFSGVLKCNLKTITPIFIGSKKNIRKVNKDVNHNESFFPENGKEYIIPSSSLKGMIRGILDILTDSVVIESKIRKQEPEYKEKPYNFIDSKFYPTNDNKDLSISESIFGAIANSEVSIEKGKIFKNLQGKVYFTDGKISKLKAKISKEVLLKPLDAPSVKKILNKEKTKLLGRKYYKHQLNKNINNFRDNKLISARNTTLKQLMEKDNIFEFEIHFKNLAYHEMCILMYSLELEKEMYHKIGRGKALGMGSCKIEIEKIKLEEKDKKYLAFEKKEIYKIVKKEKFIENAKIYLELNNGERNNIKILEKILKG